MQLRSDDSVYLAGNEDICRENKMSIKVIIPAFAVLAVVFFLMPSHAMGESGRIYGTVRTIDGETFEGWIRWDKNEAYWDDILDVTKERDRKADRRRSRRMRVLGGLISWGNGSGRWSELKFGHIRTIIPTSSSDAIIILKSGEEYEMSSRSTDLGSSVRDIIVDDMREGEIYFDWDDIDEVNLSKEPTGRESRAERLYGRLMTRRGDEFIGWIEWDVDEVMTSDVLDGDEGRRRNREIEFERIQSIERRSQSSCIVTLKSGSTMKLSGTNDVNSSNKGIKVKDPSIGCIKVEWNDFDMVEFMPVPIDKLPSYDDFDGGHRIEGTVFTEDGERFSGRIIWDDDEAYTWEHLNGDYHDLDIAIEFANIKLIDKHSRRGAVITTRSGRNILLKGSNDVNSENSGIIVELEDGDEVEIDWYDFEKAEFR